MMSLLNRTKPSHCPNCASDSTYLCFYTELIPMYQVKENTSPIITCTYCGIDF